MATNTEITNEALAWVGQEPIADVTDSARRAVLSASVFDLSRRSLLMIYDWRFARARRALAASSTVTPAFGFSKAFALPADCIKPRGLWREGDNPEALTTSGIAYHVEGEYLNCNETTANLIYTKDETVTSRFDPLFRSLLALEVAKKIHYALGGNNAQMEVILREHQQVYTMARRTNAIMDTPEIVIASEWTGAHYNGSGDRFRYREKGY